MVYSSMKKLLDSFPYFLKKSSDSNFYKSEFVFNEQFKDLYNDLFQVYESFHLEKRLFIWKEQVSAYAYHINFVANYPYLKSVTCYKNNSVIYTEEYEYEDEVASFSYSYGGTSNNIIPSDKFKIIVETYEEYRLVKAFPENDTQKGNEYDHDPSLDNFGELHNIPRKKYKKLNTSDLSSSQIITYYTKTEPPFNDRLTEDDYHYMNRIIQYLSYFHKLPLPVIEIWKLYGLNPEDEKEISFINREKYLAKMFEESRHLNENGEYDPYWKPKRWEHKDTIWCPVKPDIFFFANVNNASPVQGMNITFDFEFIDEFARKTDTNYYIIPYIRTPSDDDFKRYAEGFYRDTANQGFLWTIPTDELPGIETEYEFDFVFHAYENYDEMMEENTNFLESDIIKIIIKGCNTADFYVDCVDGLDTNDGKTRQTAFRTLKYALSQMHGSENVLALVNKNEYFYIDDVQVIDEICSIISCPAGATIYQNNGWEFFKIMQDTSLYLQNINLKHKCCIMHSKSTDFIDKNVLNYPIHVKIPKWVCKIATKINMTRDYTVYAHHELELPGSLLTDVGDWEVGATYVDGITKDCPVSKREPDEPVKGEEVKLYLNNNLLDTETTGNDGGYEFNHTFEAIGSFNLVVKHNESKKYCHSENYYIVKVDPMPTKLTITQPSEKIYIEESFDVPYNIVNYYDEPVNVGVLKLYEDNRLVKTINNGETLSYTPTTTGEHSYRVEWSHDNTYVSSSVEFKVNVIKYSPTLFLMGEGKSVYTIDENVVFTGVLTDEFNRKLSNMQVKVYDGTTLLTTLTTNNEGEITYSGKFSVGTHNFHLEFNETPKYYSAISNNYRVRVRDGALADIQLYLYPEHKVLGSKLSNIPVHVYACNKQGEPLSTSFKIWDTYNSTCETTTSPTYTTSADGWWSGEVSTQAIVECEGTYLQAVSTIDPDVYSNVAHIRYTVEPELTVVGGIYTRESVYSYSDDVIHVEGYLADEEEDPVPNESIIVKMLNAETETVIATKTLTTDLRGEWETTFTTNSTVRGHDLMFKIEYSKVAHKYKSFTDSIIVVFKQLETTICAENISIVEGDYIDITGSVIDENNRLVDTGNVTIQFNDETDTLPLSNGEFALNIEDIIDVGTYDAVINFNVNDYYKASTKTITVDVNEVNPTLLLTEPYYSYNNENIHLSGSLLTEDNDPVSDSFTVKAYVDNTLIQTFNLTSDSNGMFAADYKTKSSHRGKDVIFKLEYYKRNGAYLVCETESTLEFKQLSTTISASNIEVIAGQKVRLTGSVIDENNLPADTGSVKITFEGTNYNVNLAEGNFSLVVDKLLTPTNHTATVLFVENTYYKTSTKNITVSVSKITPIINMVKTHTLIRDESYIIPYTFELPPITDKISADIPVSGTLKLQKTDNTTITTINLNEDLEVTFAQKQTIQCKLVYSGSEYVATLTVTGIKLEVTDPSIIIRDTPTGAWDINLVDEFPSSTSNYDEDDYLIRTEYLDDGNPKLTITDDPDYDTSDAGEEDIVLIDADDEDEEVVIK